MDKFSIIIPIYNTENYLEECIKSVINQTYENVEIILVNDGSPGNADEICKKYLAKDCRIKYFYQENQGVAIARNYGISNATGKYVFCVDSDDTIERDFINKIFKTFKQANYDLVVIGKTLCEREIKRIGALPTCGLAFTKELLDKYPDVRFQEHMQPCEDGLFTHKLLALTDNIGKCPNAKYIYRQHSKSSEHNINTDKLYNDIQKWFEILGEFYKKYGNLQENKIHILDFIENEPFGRLNNVSFSLSQKKYLFEVIKNFINSYDLYNSDILKIYRYNQNYLCFLLSTNYLEFQNEILLNDINYLRINENVYIKKYKKYKRLFKLFFCLSIVITLFVIYMGVLWIKY